MGLLAYAMAGEGRGHASRSKSVADELLARGESIVFVTGGDALDFLNECYADDARVHFVEIPVLRFVYTKIGKIKRIHLPKTMRNFFSFVWHMRGTLKAAQAELQQRGLKPELMICDFEPLAPRLASRMRLPLVTLDNQHFYRHARLRDFSPIFWPGLLLLHFVCSVFVPHPDLTLICNFTLPEAIDETPRVRMIGPLVRKEIREAVLPVRTDDFVLCYLRESIANESLKALEELYCRAIVYGLSLREPRGKIIFKDISKTEFVEDLVRCDRVIGTSGAQLISECIHLNKPLFVIPEKGHSEQIMNARLAEPLGVQRHRFGSLRKSMEAFLQSKPQLINPYKEEGARKAAELILEYKNRK